MQTLTAFCMGIAYVLHLGSVSQARSDEKSMGTERHAHVSVLYHPTVALGAEHPIGTIMGMGMGIVGLEHPTPHRDGRTQDSASS
ncbi:hypothetical protein F4809DRAFT_586385 [Biscogniauxia mediterranea]|nr:hypothetical protein F4809DRAFT_586385 [Biscogniauxia mediterranea]